MKVLLTLFSIGLSFLFNPAFAMTHPACPDASYFTVEGDNGVKYGYFDNKTCIVESRFPACPDASYDSDGDRYGWYNGETCWVLSQDLPSSDVAAGHPECPDASYATVRGLNGVLYGYYDDASCIVNESDTDAGGDNNDGMTDDTNTNDVATGHPECPDASYATVRGLNGVLYGYYNDTSCIVNESDTDAGGDTNDGMTDDTNTDDDMNDDSMNDDSMNDDSMNDDSMNDDGMNDDSMNDDSMNDDGMNDDSMNDDGMNDDSMNDDGMSDGTTDPTVRVSTYLPVTQYPEDTCLTLQDTRDRNYHGSILLGDFILSTNAWNFGAAGDYPWEQCIYTGTNGEVAGWSYDWGTDNGPNDYLVRSYPELIYGVKSQGEISAPKSVTGLPAKVGSLPVISIDYSYSGTEDGPSRAVRVPVNDRYAVGDQIQGERNLAVESFFHPADASGNCPESVVQRDSSGSNHTYEMMVWLDSGAERLPSGPADEVTTATIDGAEYRVFTKDSDRKYTAFVAVNPQPSGTIVWSSFIDWVQTYSHRAVEEFGARTNSVKLLDDWCLGNILVGNEIFWGAGNLDLLEWTIRQNP